MNHYTDDRIDRSEKDGSGSRWVWLLLGLVIIGLLVFQLMKAPSSPPATYELLEPEPPIEIIQPLPATATPSEDGSPANEQNIEPEQAVPTNSAPVPMSESPPLVLNDSDPVVRQLADDIALPSPLQTLLMPAELVRKATVFVDTLSKGGILRSSVMALKPDEKFSATKMSDKVYMLNPASYSRYDAVTEAFVELNAEALVAAFVKMEPLFEQAYGELGYPDGTFRDALTEAISVLKATPVLEEEIQLVRPSVMYKFADAELESLSRAQKQLIRMGPSNTRKIQSKLATLERLLESAAK